MEFLGFPALQFTGELAIIQYPAAYPGAVEFVILRSVSIMGYRFGSPWYGLRLYRFNVLFDAQSLSNLGKSICFQFLIIWNVNVFFVNSNKENRFLLCYLEDIIRIFESNGQYSKKVFHLDVLIYFIISNLKKFIDIIPWQDLFWKLSYIDSFTNIQLNLIVTKLKVFVLTKADLMKLMVVQQRV